MAIRRTAILLLLVMSTYGSWAIAQSDDICTPALVWGESRWGSSNWGFETACEIRSNILQLIILLKKLEGDP